MLSGYFHFGNSHFFIEFSLIKDVVQVLADGRHTHTKQLRHRLLRSLYRLILDDDLHLPFLLRQLVEYELYFVAHVDYNIYIVSEMW